MGKGLSVSLILLGALASMGASFQTTNFIVEAPTPEIARQVATYAEKYRREKAVEWLGYEMPAWLRPCPLRATVTMGGAGGATTFDFGDCRGQIMDQHMHIEGSLDRLLLSVLPHEVTHTVFAYHFRRPLPRWADEGGSVLSEDDRERQHHEDLNREILSTGRAIRLRQLFSLHDYPRDVLALYAEGYSVTNFLVGASNRQIFLAFIAHGMQRGWDSAVQTFYRYQNVEQLEGAWINYLRQPHPQSALLARNNRPAPMDPASRLVVRQTAPPPPPLLDAPQPIFRGQVEDDPFNPADSAPGGRPAYLPTYTPARPNDPTPGSAPQPPAGDWRPIPLPPSASVGGVHLGPPQLGPSAVDNQPGVSSGASPAGYPR